MKEEFQYLLPMEINGDFANFDLANDSAVSRYQDQ